MDKPEAGLKYEHTFNQTPNFNVRLTKLHRLPTEEFDRRAPTDALYHARRLPLCRSLIVDSIKSTNYILAHIARMCVKSPKEEIPSIEKKQFFP